MKLGDPLPAFWPGMDWIFGPSGLEPHAPASPVLIHSFSAGCPLCEEGAQHVSAWRERFRADGLRVIGMFQARSDVPLPSRQEIERIARDLMGVDHPCLSDNDGSLTRRLGIPYAPGYLLFDVGHKLRHRQMGNARLDIIESTIERLVKASSGSKSYDKDHGASAS